jgi:probable rRNA maturation factor
MSGEHAGIEIDVRFAPSLESLSLTGTVSADWIRSVATNTLLHEGRSGEMTIVLTDDEGIRSLNRGFLGEDVPTDVLSFAAQEDGGPFVIAPEAGGYLGDVIVSFPRVVEQAAGEEHSVEQELNLLIVHGVLHLLGYDHADEEDKAAMWARQDAILSGLR